MDNLMFEEITDEESFNIDGGEWWHWAIAIGVVAVVAAVTVAVCCATGGTAAAAAPVLTSTGSITSLVADITEVALAKNLLILPTIIAL